jgi:class 3 adenylate cyclase/CHASE2 domain-containing sensor protein/tetratricopeptide (TPR) repeat protein
MTRVKRVGLVAVIMGVLTALLAASDVALGLEETFGLDSLFRARGPVEPPRGAAVLRLDRAGLETLRDLPPETARWPEPMAGCARRWPILAGIASTPSLDALPRHLYACIVQRLHELGAQSIVFDVAFTDRPDRREGTTALAEAIGAHGRVALLEHADRLIVTTKAQAGAAPLVVGTVERVSPELAAAAAGRAPFTLPRIADGVRRFWVRNPALPAPMLLPGRAVELAALDALQRFADRAGVPLPEGLPRDQRRAALVSGFLSLSEGGALPAALDGNDERMLDAVLRVHRGQAHRYFHFYGPAGTLPSLSFGDLLTGQTTTVGTAGSAAPLRGLTVFVGRADLALTRQVDSFATVMTNAAGQQVSGVELAATAYLNLLHDDAMGQVPQPWQWLIVFGLAALFTVAAGLGTVWGGLLWSAALAIGWAVASYLAFARARLYLPVAVPLLVAFPAAAIIGALLHYLAAKRGLELYLPRALARRLSRGEDLRGAASDHELTVMFTDITGFTAISERLQRVSPKAVQDFQQRHFSLVIPAIAAHGGEIKDFTGDGVLAVWGWPEPDPDHADHACKSALAIAGAIARDNDRERQEGEEPVRMRIGIHSGIARSGDIGVLNRRMLTLSGDVVNAAQRIEQLGKALCPDAPTVSILISGATANRLGAGFALEPLGLHVLRGRENREQIYRLKAAQRVRPAAPVAAALLLALGTALGTSTARANACDEPVAVLVAAEQDVTVDGIPAEPGPGGVPLCAGAVLEIGPSGRAAVQYLAADTIARFDANSATRILSPEAPESGVIELLRGALFFVSQVRRTLTVNTPYVTAGIEGTEVLVRLGEGDAPAVDLRVYDGQVRLSNGSRFRPRLTQSVVTTGERLVVGADLTTSLQRPDEFEGGAMRAGAARELAWTLYYPPLFDETAPPSTTLADAARLLGVGDVDAAERLLAGIRDDDAEAAGRDALRSLIATVQGDPAAGLGMAEAAHAAFPAVAAPLLARSYAEQALRRLPEALASAQAAVRADAGSALAWSRLAEMQLAMGEARQANISADRALGLGQPALALVVQGFGRLASFDVDAARASFEAALRLEDQQPLAHLGLGLALIRRNHLLEGRRQIEVAAGLDPTRSLLRSYLGKAYFEELRNRDAGQQLAMARQLDPDDPTPWFYDAIRKQQENRPVEALHDLERSIGLNDNRATFRSGILLDQDRATREASLGRIYKDLGFTQLGRLAAGAALDVDPASSGAHRLLADLYSADPNLEVARVSEVLQTQLLQGVGLNPVQPSLGFADLDLPYQSGFDTVGIGEYSSLFERDGVLLGATGVVGNQGTWGEEASLSALYGRTSLSLGQFHYETDGFRPNNDLKHDIVSALLQAALTPEFTVQAEFRYRDSDLGDRTMNFDPDSFDPTLRRRIEERTLRVGGNWQLSPGSNLIANFSTGKRDERVENSETLSFDPVLPPLEARSIFNTHGEAYSGELAWLAQARRATLTVGGGFYQSDTRLNPSCYGNACGSSGRSTVDGPGGNAYAYSTMFPGPALDLTLGIGAAGFSDEDYYDQTKVLPKVGVTWRVLPTVTLRGAAFRAFRRPVLVNQTIEPTEVAGFAQFYDGLNATLSDVVAVGLDTRPVQHLALGASGIYRGAAPPYQDSSPKVADDHDQILKSYLYWELDERVVLGLEPAYSLFERAEKDAQATGAPFRIRTIEAPLSIRYFAPSGLFVEGAMTLLHQQVQRFEANLATGNTDRLSDHGQSILFDAGIGWRLPNRWGAIRLDVLNVLDTEVEYQDDSFRTAEQVRSLRFAPERTILLRGSFSW